MYCLSDSYKKELSYCTFCPKLCRFACPVTNAEFRETVTPTVKMTFLKLVRDGAVPLTSDEADIFYRCLGCGLCKAYCKHRIDVGEIMIDARQQCIAGGFSPEPVKEYVADLKIRMDKPMAGIKDALDSLQQERRINRASKIMYFIGEETILRDPGAAKAAIEILEYGGVDFAVPGENDMFTGAMSHIAGDHETFAAAAKKLSAHLNSYELILCGDPDTIYLFKEKYPAVGAAIKGQVKHIVEYVVELMEASRLAFAEPTNEKVMYHDPCKLARYLGVIEQPRKLLEKIFAPENIREFSWNRDKTYCCGGGALLDISAPETAAAIARKRMVELREYKPDVLVTACPVCAGQFRKFDGNIRVKDIATVLAERLNK